VKELLLLTLTLALLLVAGVLFAAGAEGSPAQAAVESPCQPVTDVRLTYTPTHVFTYTPVLFGGEIVTGSLPVTYLWAFGDGTSPVTGMAATPVLTAAHTFTSAEVYTVSLAAWNSCTLTPTQWAVTLTVSPCEARAFLPLAGRQVQVPAHLGYGANIASADHAISLTVMGFDWAKGFVSWGEAGEGPVYSWVAVDNQLREFVPQVQHVLLRVGGPPPTGIGNPPVSASDLAAFHNFAQALAAHISSVWRPQGLETAAYEIWNEPNLDYEWGGHPNAAQYTALLKVAYGAIKAGDPGAIVVSAALATTGGSVTDLALARQLYNAVEVVPDLAFLRAMYDNGVKGYLDALGSHPYGGPDAPGMPPGEASGPIYFRRAEEQHDVMLAYGDASPVWATEFGWVLETSCNLGEHEWMEVGEAQQAEYLAAAYAYADENWPWMGPMFLFNLDFGTCYWYERCDPMRWYSVTYRENPYDPENSPIQPRQAFYSLRDLPKHSAW
jgi:PKD repeat protein